MSQKSRIRGSVFQVAAVCALALSGCATTVLPPQRLLKPDLAEVMGESVQMGGPTHFGGHRSGMNGSSECTSCQDRQRLQDYAHCAMPYVAGPFMHGSAEPAYAVEQATIKPPHSKFHPVPTRPVFETRLDDHPPQPIGVELVPVPEQEWQPTEPYDLDHADTFMLSPLSN